MRRSLPIFALALYAAIGDAGEPNQRWTFDAAKLRPIWLSPTLDGESVLFIQEGAGARPKAAILFRPTKILADLVILAFGMNDASGLPAVRYQANIKGMIDAVRKARPQCEFILVATMLGNKDWTALHPELFPQYRDALAQLCGQGIALADMTSIWAELLKQKKDWDMTGNGVNHPNDFGHRVYAQVLCALLVGNAPQP